MKDSMILNTFLGVILALALGILIGIVCGVERVQKQAVANGAGHWVGMGPNSSEFAWGTAPRN